LSHTPIKLFNCFKTKQTSTRFLLQLRLCLRSFNSLANRQVAATRFSSLHPSPTALGKTPRLSHAPILFDFLLILRRSGKNCGQKQNLRCLYFLIVSKIPRYTRQTTRVCALKYYTE
ncbi:MAG: hypothetical protein IJB49_01590, partial [Clostridia bacterium]|nr:hypothetical protein [Clostridia bacterium]